MAKYRIIIAGSRTFDDYDVLKDVMDRVMSFVLWNKDDTATFVSGHADGADQLGEKYAKYERDAHCDIFPAEWDKYGKNAGFIRNEQMAQFATQRGYRGILVAFYGGNVSGGTKNMIDQANRYGMYVYVVEYKDGIRKSEYWLFSKKQDDEYAGLAANVRYTLSMLSSEFPTGICGFALDQGHCSCEDCEGVYCYDKAESCRRRIQIWQDEDGYHMGHIPCTGEVASKTNDYIKEFIKLGIDNEQVQRAVAEFTAYMKSTPKDKEKIVPVLSRSITATILAGLINEE